MMMLLNWPYTDQQEYLTVDQNKERGLGGRSLVINPLAENAKDKINTIKEENGTDHLLCCNGRVCIWLF